MTPEEIQMVDHWIAYLQSDEMVGVNWHQHIRNRGCNPPQESFTETGRRLRREVLEAKGRKT